MTDRDYEEPTVQEIIACLRAAKLVDGDPALMRAAELSGPERNSIQPRDDCRADTHLAIKTLLSELAEGNSDNAFDLWKSAFSAANKWLIVRKI